MKTICSPPPPLLNILLCHVYICSYFRIKINNKNKFKSKSELNIEDGFYV